MKRGNQQGQILKKDVELKTGTSEEAEVKALFDLFDNDGDRFLLFICRK